MREVTHDWWLCLTAKGKNARNFLCVAFSASNMKKKTDFKHFLAVLVFFFFLQLLSIRVELKCSFPSNIRFNQSLILIIKFRGSF